MKIDRSIIEKMEEERDKLKDMLEEVFIELGMEIFGSGPVISGKEFKNPVKPNMELIDKYFRIKRRL